MSSSPDGDASGDGLVAPALEPAVRVFEQVFELAVCYRDPNVAGYGLTNAVFPLGASFLEVPASSRNPTERM